MDRNSRLWQKKPVTIANLPAVNATLNSVSALGLVLGYCFIRRGRKAAHRNCMVGAVIASAAFLACYAVYHAHTGRILFREPTWFRPLYLAILLSHTVLAMAIVPLVLVTLGLAARRHFETHRKWARWTWPLWIYVSVTGVPIYLLLYQILPQALPTDGVSPPVLELETAGMVQELPGESELDGEAGGQRLDAERLSGVMASVEHVHPQLLSQRERPMGAFSRDEGIHPFLPGLLQLRPSPACDHPDPLAHRAATRQ